MRMNKRARVGIPLLRQLKFHAVLYGLEKKRQGMLLD
jgi:hypothetical protein